VGEEASKLSLQIGMRKILHIKCNLHKETQRLISQTLWEIQNPVFLTKKTGFSKPPFTSHISMMQIWFITQPFTLSVFQTVTKVGHITLILSETTRTFKILLRNYRSHYIWCPWTHKLANDKLLKSFLLIHSPKQRPQKAPGYYSADWH
jgi:hypothetical protein